MGRPRWDRTGDSCDPATLGDDLIIEVYFSSNIAEYFATGTARITMDDTPIKQERYCVLSTAHV